jgi:hypothetical protein
VYGTEAVALIARAALGTRLVVRYRFEDGATDALGYLRERTEFSCVIDTKRGPVSVRLDTVVAAKPVPEPPAPRPRRTPTSGE